MKAFGKYQLIEEIGNSPNGTTYRACDQLSSRIVAVKILQSTGISPEAKMRLCRELGACAELQHPNLARILDTGEIDGTIYVASELLQGVDLRRHLQERRTMPLSRKLRIMAQIYDGMAFAHQKQITHGSIKPGNIFLAELAETRRNEGKILDFGAGKLSGRADDVASDLFGAAAALYELVAEVPPFQTPIEPRPLRKIDSQIPEELDRLVMAALAKDPAERPRTAEIMAASLCAIAQQLPQPAEPARAIVAAAPLAATAAAGASSGMKGPVTQITANQVTATQVTPSPTASAAPQPAREVSLEAGKAVAAATPASPGPVAAVNPAAVHTAEKNAITGEPAVAKRSPARLGIVVALAAMLALFLMAGLLTKQVSKATPSLPLSEVPAASAPPSPANPPAEAQPQLAVETPKSESASPEADKILNGQTEALWESGQYAQAMTLVDAILAAEPDNAEALAWKKKIRAAQQAEAALR